jgi:adenylate cyclase
LSGERVERRLAAILAADIAGYSRLMGRNEAGILARVRALRRELIDPNIAEHKGRIVKTTGDGILIEFPSVVEAVAAAVTLQQELAQRNADVPGEERIEFRVGINLGDVIVEDGDIHGDGVNVAARLEAVAEPGGICVSAVVQDQVRGRLEIGFEDMGEQNLKNIARPVRVYRVQGKGAASSAAMTPALALPEKPSIAVLPFQNMSGDPEQEYFADGMVEEIITALSRIRWLFVIARNSTFTYKGQAVDVKQVGRELGVRYVLEGSVRKAAGRVRITAQLIEAKTGTHLWADRFDGSLEDVFDLQDQVATSVAGVIEPALQRAEISRIADRPTSDLSAYDLYLRSMTLFWSLTKDGVHRAIDLLEQAITRDPHYGPALGWLAIFRWHLTFTWPEDIEENRGKAVGLARRALSEASNDPAVIANAAMVLAAFGEDLDAMTALVARAVSLNPSYGRGWYIGGMLDMFAGRHEAAIEKEEISLRLNPRDRFSQPSMIVGFACFFLRRFEDAAEKLQIVVQENPQYPNPWRYLACCYAHTGRIDEARAAIARAGSSTVGAVGSANPFRRAEDRELFVSGMRLAMGETE